MLIGFCLFNVKWFISDTWRKCGPQMTGVHLNLTCSLFLSSCLELPKLKVDLCRFIKDTNWVTRFSLFLTTKATFFPRMAFDNWKRGHRCVKTLMTFSSCHSNVTECDSWISVAQRCVWGRRSSTNSIESFKQKHSQRSRTNLWLQQHAALWTAPPILTEAMEMSRLLTYSTDYHWGTNIPRYK